MVRRPHGVSRHPKPLRLLPKRLGKIAGGSPMANGDAMPCAGAMPCADQMPGGDAMACGDAMTCGHGIAGGEAMAHMDPRAHTIPRRACACHMPGPGAARVECAGSMGCAYVLHVC